MARKSKAPARSERKGKDAGKKFKKKVCIFCTNGVTWIDYKDVNLLRRFMSDRAKIRARRVTGNCAQHQRDIAIAIKTARELALLPYATRVTSSRGGGRGGPRGRDRDDRGPRPDRDAARPTSPDGTETATGVAPDDELEVLDAEAAADVVVGGEAE
jgi:small subunit ribosomal protein S18